MPEDTDFNFDMFLFDDDKVDEQAERRQSDKVLEAKRGTVKEVRAKDVPLKELPVEFTGNAEKDGKIETDYVLGEFRKRMNREQQRIEYTNDAEFFCVIVFQSKGQRDAFVEEIGNVDIDGDNQFLDGIEVAKKFKIEIPEVDLTFRPPSIDPAFRDYTH
jgi:hypothetical protein